MRGPFLTWGELILLLPLCGAAWVWRVRDSAKARQRVLIVCALIFFCTVGAWAQFALGGGTLERSPNDLLVRLRDAELFAIDGLNAPIITLVALLYLLIVLATVGSKVQQVAFGRIMISEGILLGTLACVSSIGIRLFLAAGTILPWIELRSLRQPTRGYLFHAVLFLLLLAAGPIAVALCAADRSSNGPLIFLTVAIVLRSSLVPMQSWLVDLFEHATLGTAMLFATPIVGAYALVRLVLVTAPDWLLHAFAILSLVTAVYTGGMALVQSGARKLFCYLFLSSSSMVFVGLATATPLSLTGALCSWLSVALALTGFGLTLRAIESRVGRISLDEFHGLYERTPSLAVLFLITGLASIGFPGTAGFIGAELLVDGAVTVSPLIGMGIVMTAALNGLAVLHAYFRIFTGTRPIGTIDLRSQRPERVAVLVLVTLILGGGLFAQPGVASRYELAEHLVTMRRGRWAQHPTAVFESRPVATMKSATGR